MDEEFAVGHALPCLFQFCQCGPCLDAGFEDGPGFDLGVCRWQQGQVVVGVIGVPVHVGPF